MLIAFPLTLYCLLTSFSHHPVRKHLSGSFQRTAEILQNHLQKLKISPFFATNGNAFSLHISLTLHALSRNNQIDYPSLTFHTNDYNLLYLNLISRSTHFFSLLSFQSYLIFY